MRSGEYGFDYINPVYGRTAIKAKAAQKTNVIFALCNGGATLRGELCEFLGGGELVKRCDPMVKARVMNQLQKWKKSGQTTEQLENTLKTPQAKILIVLELCKEEGHVTKSENGVWTLVRGRTPDESPGRHAGDDSNDAV
jgi:hypothetical protein